MAISCQEAARGAKTLATDAVKKAESMAAKMEKAHEKTIAEVGVLSSKVDEALRLANDALEKVGAIASSLLTRWESVVVILAITGAAAMLGLGLALLIRP